MSGRLSLATPSRLSEGRLSGGDRAMKSARYAERSRSTESEAGMREDQSANTAAVIAIHRCAWATSPLSIPYHDEEWGVPLHDDRALFEFLILEGAQAGLSWETILKKRDNYRVAFEGFDPARVARYGSAELARLLADPGIVRNRAKIAAAIQNARAYLAVQEEFGSFDAYIWRFVGGRPIVNAWRSLTDLPARTAESEAMSKDLKRRGFAFVGATICYAHMQATGMVNDHTTDCFRYPRV
jgi:DNA-3-methyladenine glycosylase I